MTLQHDLRLVALSLLICGLGCFTTVVLLSRSQAADRHAGWWTLAAAAVFGCSVWSLHFVALLAFTSELAMRYDLGATVASVVFAVAGSWAALRVVRGRAPRWYRVGLGALLLGGAVAGMHYIGVAAMRFSGFLVFDAKMVAASLAVAAAFPLPALARGTDLSRLSRRLEIAGWLAAGICCLHFAGMAAVRVAPGHPDAAGGALLGTTSLAVAVGGVSVLILLASLAALTVEHLAQRTVQELARMRLLSDLSHEVLMIQRDGIVLEVNSAGERMFKRPAADLIGQPVLSLFAEASQPAMLHRMKCRSEQPPSEEMQIQASDGTQPVIEISCRPIAFLGRPARALALRDLTDRRCNEDRIRHLARHDALTGLLNRYALQQHLADVLDAAAQEATEIAVIYLDFDRFKPINDLFGYAVGDELLVRAGRRMQEELGPGDMVARIGGDEFVIVVTSAAQAATVSAMAGRIIQRLRMPFQVEGHKMQIGVSAGIALYPGDGHTPDMLLRAADMAMYRVKDEGRGTLRFFEPAMDTQLQTRCLLEQELGGAVATDELLLHYQPILNSANGAVETFEALIRWNHPVRGLVPPTEFIPVAEETGLICTIGAWVIDTVCAAAARWPQPWRVAVNVSPVQFRDGDICAVVAAALKRHDLPANRLVIEITEGVFMADAANAVALLNRLRDMGISIALDDFGTGFSSLSYLQLFRFDRLKIDKSFVMRLGESEEALTITRAIINLGHNLGLQVTAEGVEVPLQLAMLQSLGCDQIQGYLVARPAPDGSFTEHDFRRARSLVRSEPFRLSA